MTARERIDLMAQFDAFLTMCESDKSLFVGFISAKVKFLDEKSFSMSSGSGCPSVVLQDQIGIHKALQLFECVCDEIKRANLTSVTMANTRDNFRTEN